MLACCLAVSPLLHAYCLAVLPVLLACCLAVSPLLLDYCLPKVKSAHTHTHHSLTTAFGDHLPECPYTRQSFVAVNSLPVVYEPKDPSAIWAPYSSVCISRFPSRQQKKVFCNYHTLPHFLSLIVGKLSIMADHLHTADHQGGLGKGHLYLWLFHIQLLLDFKYKPS